MSQAEEYLFGFGGVALLYNLTLFRFPSLLEKVPEGRMRLLIGLLSTK
jgi:hypothetical protein